MGQKKIKRGENWTYEEKEILRQLIAKSVHIIENKSTKTTVNVQKVKEWKKIQAKFNELADKSRSDGELRLAWKRMKISAKSNLAAHRQEQNKTVDNKKPPSPSSEDLAILAITSHNFVIKDHDYENDASNPVPKPTIDKNYTYTEPKPGTSFVAILEENPEQHVVYLQDTESSKSNTKSTPKKSLHNGNEEMHQSTDFKRRQLEMLELEHQYNIKISRLKIKKLELEISLLENMKQIDNDE